MSLSNNTGSRVSTKRGTPDWPVRPVNLASKMAPKEKTLVKEKARKRKSPKGKEKATVIREESEVNLF